jgi:hypothetical protein
MRVNTQELIKQTHRASATLVQEKGYMSAVDVLMALGKLSKEDYERWRCRQVPYVEQVITVNLHKISVVLRTMHQHARHRDLHPSKTVYTSWGKGPRMLLRFSKSGDPRLEDTYSTHFVTRQEGRE